MQMLNIKVLIGICAISAIVMCYLYVNSLKNDLVQSQKNEVALELAVEKQSKIIKSKNDSIIEIKKENAELIVLSIEHQKELQNLQEKFNTKKSGKPRDFGYLAIKKTKRMQRLINEGTEKVNRCFEL